MVVTLKKSKRPVTYYVQVLNPATNVIVARALAEEATESEERSVLCADGVRRDLYSCPRQIVCTLFDIHDANVRFRAFYRHGRGKIYPAPDFLFRKRGASVKVGKKCLLMPTDLRQR